LRACRTPIYARWHLLEMANHLLHQPIIDVLQQAQARGEAGFPNPYMAAFAFMSMVQGFNAVPLGERRINADTAVQEMVDLFVYGVRGK
jgi:hypothetical protein